MLQKKVLDEELVYVDETSWRLMKKGGTKRWCCSTAGSRSPPMVVESSSRWHRPEAGLEHDSVLAASCSACITNHQRAGTWKNAPSRAAMMGVRGCCPASRRPVLRGAQHQPRFER